MGTPATLRSYRKGDIVQLSAHFWLHEFDCHCLRPECQTTLVDLALIQALEALREKVQLVHIDCGYRCSAHNHDVGGVENSQHCQGKAADIKTPLGPQATKANAENIPALAHGGIGIYQTFVHVDVRDGKARWEGPGVNKKLC